MVKHAKTLKGGFSIDATFAVIEKQSQMRDPDIALLLTRLGHNCLKQGRPHILGHGKCPRHVLGPSLLKITCWEHSNS